MALPQGKLDVAPVCPVCRAKLDGWTALEPESKPSDGDASVCLYCATPLEFKDNCTRLRILQPDEFERHPCREQLRKAQLAVIRLNGRRN